MLKVRHFGSAPPSDPLIVRGATIIGGATDEILVDRDIRVERGVINEIGPSQAEPPAGIRQIDARGKYVIPGLMDAVVHLMGDIRLEHLVRYEDRYEDLITEAAQVALRAGVTTVFDNWGPLKPLAAVRAKIEAGLVPGARIFCAGNVVGLGGPFSSDFIPKAAGVASTCLVAQISELWERNVGPRLFENDAITISKAFEAYLDQEPDFVKIALRYSNLGQKPARVPTEILADLVQRAHRRGLVVHAQTADEQDIVRAIEAGCDIHGAHSGSQPLSEDAVRSIATRRTGTTLFPLTQRRLEWLIRMRANPGEVWQSSNENTGRLLALGARALMSTEGSLQAKEAMGDPTYGSLLSYDPAEGSPSLLGEGHLYWFRAMQEKGVAAIDTLRMATRNVADAYGRGTELGTIEIGKIADLVVLAKNPLEHWQNYRTITAVVKAGREIDLATIPTQRILASNDLDGAQQVSRKSHRDLNAGPYD